MYRIKRKEIKKESKKKIFVRWFDGVFSSFGRNHGSHCIPQTNPLQTIIVLNEGIKFDL